VRGDAPDWQRLFERREDYAENTVPPLGLLLVAGADVQHSGIWLEVVAFAPDRQSWTVSARFLGRRHDRPAPRRLRRARQGLR
jgi:phage terminase large subunit GpA-like protein